MHLFTLHHLDASNQLDPVRTAYRRWAAGRGLHSARLVITNSRCAARRIIAVAPEAERKMIQSYEGIDHSVFRAEYPNGEADELRRALEIPENYILWLSNLYPYKQADLLVRSYARISQRLREMYPIVFVGEIGPIRGLRWKDSQRTYQ